MLKSGGCLLVHFVNLLYTLCDCSQPWWFALVSCSSCSSLDFKVEHINHTDAVEKRTSIPSAWSLIHRITSYIWGSCAAMRSATFYESPEKYLPAAHIARIIFKEETKSESVLSQVTANKKLLHFKWSRAFLPILLYSEYTLLLVLYLEYILLLVLYSEYIFSLTFQL